MSARPSCSGIPRSATSTSNRCLASRCNASPADPAVITSAPPLTAAAAMTTEKTMTFERWLASPSGRPKTTKVTATLRDANTAASATRQRKWHSAATPIVAPTLVMAHAAIPTNAPRHKPSQAQIKVRRSLRRARVAKVDSRVLPFGDRGGSHEGRGCRCSRRTLRPTLLASTERHPGSKVASAIPVGTQTVVAGSATTATRNPRWAARKGSLFERTPRRVPPPKTAAKRLDQSA